MKNITKINEKIGKRVVEVEEQIDLDDYERKVEELTSQLQKAIAERDEVKDALK